MLILSRSVRVRQFLFLNGQFLKIFSSETAWQNKMKFYRNFSLQGVLDKALCDKVCQWLGAGWWVSPGTPVSSNNKAVCHDIAEILMKVALNTITLTLHTYNMDSQCFIQHYWRNIQKMVLYSVFQMRVSDDFWDYLNTTVIDKLERTSSYDREDKTEGSEFLLLGAFRLRQIRTERGIFIITICDYMKRK